MPGAEVDDDASFVRRLLRRLVETARVLTTQEERAVRILAPWIKDTLLGKAARLIRQSPLAPVMCMYSSDGWSATVATKTIETIGPHIRVDHRGRVRHEFCLERALIRQRRPCGTEDLVAIVGKPLGMCHGRRHGNFFTAAVRFVPSLLDLGARGVKIQLFTLDGLHYSSFMRLMRGRFALRCSDGSLFDDEDQRLQHWFLEWVLGNSCKSHACSNAVVWSLRRYSGKDVQENCHIAIKSLRNTSEDLRGKIQEFVRSRVAGVARDTSVDEVRQFWQFFQIREDLFPLFVQADPVWDGRLLLVNEEFLLRPDASRVLETMILYLLSWSDWSETRWCAVKTASRRMLRSVCCGVHRLVALVKADPDVASCFINGYARFDEEARFYLCVAAFSSSPAEAVQIKLLKDDRFLRFCPELRRDMECELSNICHYPKLIWRRLRDIVYRDGERSWLALRSECIRSCLIGAGYLEMQAFSMVRKAPWVYTQGDIAKHIKDIGMARLDELPEDETTRKIAVGLANGVRPEVFEEALALLRDASMTTNANEKAHGYGARLHDDHAQYGYEMIAGRSTVNSCLSLFHATGRQRQMEALQEKVARLDRKRPDRASSTALFFRDRARERCAQGFGEGAAPFEDLQATMSASAKRWGDMTVSERRPYLAARGDHIAERRGVIKQARGELLARSEALRVEEEEELAARGLPNLISAAEKFDDEDLEALSGLLRGAHVVGVPGGVMATAPEEPTVGEMNELEQRNADLHPQCPVDPERPWWVRHIAMHRDEWYGSAIFDEDAEESRCFVLLFASKSPYLAWFLECREKDRIMQPGIGAGTDYDVPDNYKEFELLDPLRLIPDHQVPLSDETAIGVYRNTVFMGATLCVFHAPGSFEEFLASLPLVEERAAKKAPRPRAPRASVDQLLQAHPWLSREDFQDEVVRRPNPSKRRRVDQRAGEAYLNEDAGEVVPPSPPPVCEEECEPQEEEAGEDEATNVQEELQAIREEVAQTLDDHADLYFKVTTRGGEWTHVHVGVAADSVRGEARGDLVKSWCKKFKWPLSMTFSMRRYGQEGSARLAKEFCRRATWFYRLCIESADPDAFQYSPGVGLTVPEDTDFLDHVLALDPEDVVLLKAHELRGLSPRAG